MRSTILKGAVVALLFGLAQAGASAQIKLGVAGPVTGANASFGAQLTTGVAQAAADLNAKGGILGQKIEVEHGRRRLRSQAGRLGRQQIRRRRRQIRHRPLQFGRHDPGLGSLCRQRRAVHHALGDQPEGHRPRPVGRLPHLRPRRPAGQALGRTRARRAQGQENRDPPRQDDLWPGPRRRRRAAS